MSVLIVIPARMKATRLPNKPMALIGGEPMIVQVWRRAMEAAIGDVVVACDGEEIAAAIRAVGGMAVVTDPDHPSGSDRVWEAVVKIEARGGVRGEERILASGLWPLASSYDIILNLQGDVPTLEPHLLHEVLRPLENPAVDIATLAAEITRPEEHEAPSVVKAILSLPSRGRVGVGPESGRGRNPNDGPLPTSPLQGEEKIGRALYFTRATAPYGDGPRYHHIGVYAYRRAALEKFVQLPPSPLELREKLEQLRALEAGFRIDATVVDTVPLGVDTPEDLERARKIVSGEG